MSLLVNCYATCSNDIQVSMVIKHNKPQFKILTFKIGSVDKFGYLLKKQTELVCCAKNVGLVIGPQLLKIHYYSTTTKKIQNVESFKVNPLMRFKFCTSFNPCTGLSQVVPEVFEVV